MSAFAHVSVFSRPFMHIKVLSASDAAAYRSIMLEAYEHAADAFTSTPQERAVLPLSWWVDRLAHPEGLTIALGAMEGPSLAGTVALEFSSRTKTQHKALVVAMYVRPVWRGRGFGRALMQAALNEAKARPHVTTVQLEVTEGNAAAVALYQSLGFEAYGTEPRAVHSPQGYLNKVHMWLDVTKDATYRDPVDQ